MGGFFDIRIIFIGLLWLLPALRVWGRGDAFEVEDAQGSGSDDAPSSSDIILDVNQALIPREAPESSFLIEGDIVKVSPFRIFSSASPRWSKKMGVVTIPYVISFKYDQTSVKIIQEAFEDFAKFTCIKFIPYTYQRDFISIAPLSGCFSSVGRIGGMQVVSLAPACLWRGKGVALHELMHVLGFWHEHSRADRDKYIKISWNDILSGFEINFMKSWNTNMLGGYDYSSVMHYGKTAFSMTGSPTIVPLSNSYTSLGQRWNLSSSDIARVNKLYKCSQVVAQPDISTEKAIKGNIRDFVSAEPKPRSVKTQSTVPISASQTSTSVAASTEMAQVRETFEKAEGVATILPPSTIVGKGFRTREATAKRALSSVAPTEGRNQSFAPAQRASEMERVGGDLNVTEDMLLETQPLETGTLIFRRTPPRPSLPQPEWNPFSSAKEPSSQPPRYREAYRTVGQEARTRWSSPETELTASFMTQSPHPRPVKTPVQGRTTKSGKRALHWPLLRTEATCATQVLAPSTLMAVERPLVTESRDVEVETGSFGLTARHAFSVMKKVSKALIRETMSHSERPVSHPTSEQPLEGTWAKSDSSQRSTGNPNTLSDIMELDETTGSGPGNPPTSNHGEKTRQEGTNVYGKEGGEPAYISTFSSGKASAVSQLGHRVLSSEEPSTFVVSSETQESNPLNQTGAPSLWPAITSHLASPSLSPVDSNPTGYSVEVTWSFSPVKLAGKSYRQGKPATFASLGSSLGEEGVKAIELEGGSESTNSVYTQLFSQAFTTKNTDFSSSEEVILPAAETDEAIHCTEETPLTVVPRSQSSKPAERRSNASRKGSLRSIFSTKSIENQNIQMSGHRMAKTGQPYLSTTLSTGTGARNGEVPTSNSVCLGSTTPVRAYGEREVGADLSEREQTTQNLSLDMQLALGTSKEVSPGTKTKDHSFISEGMSLSGSETLASFLETSSPVHWLSGHKNLRTRNRLGNFTQVLQNRTSPVVSEFLHTMPLKRLIPEDAITSKQGTIGSGFSTLVPDNPTLKSVQERQRIPSWEGTKLVRSSKNPPVQFLKPGTEKVVSSNAEEVASFGEGRTSYGMNGTTIPMQEAGVSASPIDVQSIASMPDALREETVLPRTTVSLESARHVNHEEGTAARRLIKETLLSAGNALSEGATSPSSEYSVSAVSLEALENVTIIPTDARWVANTMSVKRSQAAMETYATGSYPLPPAGLSTLDSHEVHIANAVAETPQFQPKPQGEIQYQRGTVWPTSGQQAKPMKRLFNEGSSPETNRAHIPVEAATGGRIGGAIGIVIGQSSPLVYTDSMKEVEEESTTVHLQEGTMPTSLGTTSRESTWNEQGAMADASNGGILEKTGSSHPGDGSSTKMAPSAQRSLDGEVTTHPLSQSHLLSSYPESTEGSVAATLLVYPPTVTPAVSQIKRQYNGMKVPPRPYGHAFLFRKGMPARTGNGEQLAHSRETARQMSKAQNASSVEGMTNQGKRMKPDENHGLLVENPGNLHHVGKRSLPEVMAYPGSLVAPLLQKRDLDHEELVPNIGYMSDNTLKMLNRHPLSALCFPECFGKRGCHRSMDCKAGVFAVENVAKMTKQPKVVGMFSGPERSSLIGSLPYAMERRKRTVLSTSQRMLEAGQPLAASSFGEDLNSSEQQRDDSLDWRLDKEPKPFTKFVANTRNLKDASRNSDDGPISLMSLTTQEPDQIAVLISSLTYAVQCLKFWYSPTVSLADQMNVYIKYLDSSEWHQVWSVKGVQSREWRPVSIAIPENLGLQVILEDEASHKTGRSSFRIANLLFCKKPCWSCSEK